jgi:hypothetical protein
LVEKKIRVRVLGKIAIYPCIDNPYGLNRHPRVEKGFEFNPTKELVRYMVSPNPMKD